MGKSATPRPEAEARGGGESGEGSDGSPEPSSPCSPAGAAPAGDPRARDRDAWRQLSRRIQVVAKKVPILPTLSWDREVKQRFLQAQGRELPRADYPDRRAEFAAAEALAREAAELHRDGDCVDAWAEATLLSYADGARMLQAVGTPEFGRLSSEVYGLAAQPVRDEPGARTHLDLARALLGDAPPCGALAPPLTADAAEVGAREAAREIQRRLREEFPRERVSVTLSRGLAAKAIAGNRRIRIRRDARFTPREVELLVVHEGLIHMATTINGLRQPFLRCLGRASPRALRLQEGLAVFAEFMGGVLDLERMRRLAERVVAVDIAQRGGDFLDVHRFFLERGQSLEEAYESARRVFRGGCPRGGAAFSKDLVYLQGLFELQRHLEELTARGGGAAAQAQLELLFVGKLALDDLSALAAARRATALVRPEHLPDWARPARLAARLAEGGPLATRAAPARGRSLRVG